MHKYIQGVSQIGLSLFFFFFIIYFFTAKSDPDKINGYLQGLGSSLFQDETFSLSAKPPTSEF